MYNQEFYNQVMNIRKDDDRYPILAYEFLGFALQYTVFRIGKQRHISAGELVDGIKKFAIIMFGPLSLMVFEQWNTRLSDDLGNMVYNFVDREFWQKTVGDKKEDFDGVMDFMDELLDVEYESVWWEEPESHNFFTARSKV